MVTSVFQRSCIYLTKILDKVFLIEVYNSLLGNPLLTSHNLYAVSKAIHSITSDSKLDRSAIQQAVGVFSSKNPMYRTQCDFDFSEAFIDLISFIHYASTTADQDLKKVEYDIIQHHAELKSDLKRPYSEKVTRFKVTRS